MTKKKQPRLTGTPVPDDSNMQSRSPRREEAARLLRDQKRRERTRKIALQAGFGAVVVAIVLGTTIALLSRDDGTDSGSGTGSGSGSGSGSTPPGLTADGAVRFGAPGDSVVLQVVEDFQCPACRQFEEGAGDLLAGYRDGGEVAVDYRPIAFLDRASTTDYSSRALNASMCVLADAGKDTWLDYHQALYDNQPDEGGAGLPDEELATMATDVGAGAGVASCIEERTYDSWVDSQTERVLAEGVQSTPTLVVNGEQLPASDPAAIQAAVEAAGAS